MERRDISKKILLVIGDAVLILVSLNLSMYIRFGQVYNVVDLFTGATVFSVFSYLVCFYVFDMYSLYFRVRSLDFVLRNIFAVFAGSLMVALMYYFLPHWKLGRGIFLINSIGVCGLTLLFRLFFQKVFGLEKKTETIVIFGVGTSGKTLYKVLKHTDKYKVIAFLDDAPDKQDVKIANLKVSGGYRTLKKMADECRVDSVAVAITHEKSPELLSALLYAKLRGIQIYDMQSLYEKVAGRIPVVHMREGWIVYTPLQGVEANLYTVKVKRLFDILLSIGGLIASFPLMLIIAIAVKLDSPGPVLFVQNRVGLNGAAYSILKFRSMREGAESGKAVWASKNDNRVTRLGKYIRRYRIDELPQLLNVLMGNMSFVGPRPERPEFVEELEKVIPFYSLRLSVKPGITGWAQVNYRYGDSKEAALEKLQYDLYYLKNLNILLDLKIIVYTIYVILRARGAR